MSRQLVEPLRRWDPERIGGYALIGRLGTGAMGRVYLGRTPAGRLVAVKTIRIELADEPDFRTRFAQEVAAARRVSGAFTAAVVAADPEADVPWLATAYVPAPTLSRLVKACGPLPGPAVRWLAAGCAEALESIHNAGLVHRDLKPSNVLVSPDGPRVIDFGVARAVERIQLTVTRGAVGTPAYMAPEQARDTRKASMASDVFSLGATMVFAATGHAPYQAETVMDVLVRLATEPPDLSGLPGDLAEVVVACMQRDPLKRPTSSSVLSYLAPGISQDASGRELGPASLPGPALALIAEYRRDPTPAAELADYGDEDMTFGSQAALVPPRKSAGRRAAGRKRPWPRRARAGAAAAGTGSAPRRIFALAVASATAAIALIAAGAAIGAAVAGHLQRPAAAASQAAQGDPPPVRPAGKPQLVMSQREGDPDTVFVVHGAGWLPEHPVALTLAGVPTPPEHPIADGRGTFSYAINQDHEFFPGPLPVGTYRMTVTGPGRATVVASFTVSRRRRGPPGGHGPPGQPVRPPGSTTDPPGGSTTPGQ
ncbi:MAG: serine/threonine-protein kinase [Streptosporangiaceae bacterium]